MKHPWFICGFVGVAGMIGLEWNFKFSLQLSVEYRPLISIQFINNGRNYLYKTIGINYYYRGLWSSAAAIGIRYKF